MPTQDGFATESELDALAAKQRGGQPQDKPLTPEEREKQRQRAADRQHAALQREPDRKAGLQRFQAAKAALYDGLQSGFRHGQATSDSDKKRITAGIIAVLGENVPDDIKAGIRRLIDAAATAYRDGEPGKAWVLADEAAAAIANADFDLGPAQADDDPGELNPAKLAASIPRG